MIGHNTLVRCPRCGSTATRCRRPSGHPAAMWHLEREDALAQECRCGVCVAWLQGRGVPLEPLQPKEATA